MDDVALDVRLKPKELGGPDPREWDYLHPDVKWGIAIIASLIQPIGYYLEITSIIRPHRTDSGIHATGRAADCVPKPIGKPKFSLPVDHCINKIAAIVCFSQRYPSWRPACIYHDSGSGYHWHIQRPADPKWKDLSGSIPEPASTPDSISQPQPQQSELT